MIRIGQIVMRVGSGDSQTRLDQGGVIWLGDGLAELVIVVPCVLSVLVDSEMPVASLSPFYPWR